MQDGAKELADRLVREWSPTKVRVLNQGRHWWRWDGHGYTLNIDEAGLWDTFTAERPEDRVIPVDPERIPLDALMMRFKSVDTLASHAVEVVPCAGMPEHIVVLTSSRASVAVDLRTGKMVHEAKP